MAAPPKRDLTVFLIKLGAATLAALVVLYAAKSWLLPSRPSGDEIVPWRQAARHYGELATVEGTVVLTRRTEKACFLNFHPDWRNAFTAVIFADCFEAFPSKPEEYYLDRKVRVTGTIREYEGKPEIILESPKQIQVVP